jgi:hypothetical protein
LGKDKLPSVLKNLLVDLSSEAFLHFPRRIILNSKVIRREISAHYYLGKHFHEVFYSHSEDAIVHIPGVDVTLALDEFTLAIEASLDIRSPEVIIHIRASATPLNCISPWASKPYYIKVFLCSSLIDALYNSGI